MIGPATPLSVQAPPYGSTEAPPWIIPGARRGYVMPTERTFDCPSSANLLTSPVAGTAADCSYMTGDAVFDYPSRTYRPPSLDYGGSLWKKHYYGALDGVVSHRGTSNPVLLAVMHGENKNEIVGGYSYQNDVNADVPVSSCTSGSWGSPPTWHDCAAAYNAFVGLAYARLGPRGTYDGAPLTDLGPIVWPQSGYRDAQGHKLSRGLKHPSAILSDGYLYVYYRDSWLTQAGNQSCIQVARAQIGSDGLPGPFKAHSQGRFAQDALPAGFDPADVAASLAVPGPTSDCILQRGVNDNRFSVAQLAGTGTFLGVEEVIDSSGGWRLALRTSPDLVTWSAPTVVASGPSWDTSPLRYPLLLSADGWSNAIADPAGFYVIGSGLPKVHALRLALAPGGGVITPTATIGP